MKKIVFALPLVALFTFCSSSRKATLPPAGPGISNVSVVTGADTIKGSSIKVNPDTRDFAYSATRDTTLQGNWSLHAMVTPDGSITTTDQWYRDTAANVVDSTFVAVNMEEPGTQTINSGSASSKEKKSVKAKNATRSKYKATASLSRYDSLMSNRVVYTDSSLNAGIKPFEYWKRIPSVTLNPTSLVFTGNTGCNMMSGSFNHSGNDIRFNRNITTSKMACNEYNESAFLDLLRKVDNYTINNDGLLELRQGNNLLLVFSKQI